VLTPVVGLLLLGGVSLVVGNPFGNPRSGLPFSNLFSYILYIVWTQVLQRLSSIGTEIQNGQVVSLVILLVLAGELVRIVYLLVQRIRGARAPQPRADTPPGTPVWASIAVPAAAIGLWVAADALLLEGLLEGYTSNPPQPIPTLGQMLDDAGSLINQAPWLVLAPLVALVILYASLNLVGFGLRGVLLRSPQPAQHSASRA
jgi:hypothetical protein